MYVGLALKEPFFFFFDIWAEKTQFQKENNMFESRILLMRCITGKVVKVL
jgi:hypothetical protein